MPPADAVPICYRCLVCGSYGMTWGIKFSGAYDEKRVPLPSCPHCGEPADFFCPFVPKPGMALRIAIDGGVKL